MKKILLALFAISLTTVDAHAMKRKRAEKKDLVEIVQEVDTKKAKVDEEFICWDRLPQEIKQHVLNLLLSEQDPLAALKQMKNFELVSQEFGEMVKDLREHTALTHRLAARILKLADKEDERFNKNKAIYLFQKICRSSDSALAQAFIQEGVLSFNTLTNMASLSLAAKYKRKETVNELLQAGVLQATNPCDQQLLSAVMAGKKHLVKRLLKRGYSPNAKIVSGVSALEIAVQNGDHCLAKKLIKHKANINGGVRGWTPLMTACLQENQEMVTLLLLLGADIHATDDNGNCAMSEAFGNKIITNLLLKAGSSIDAKNMDGNTCLMCAAQVGDRDLVEFYLSKGADVNMTNIDSRGNVFGTALTLAVRNGHTNIVKLLLNSGADIHFRSSLSHYGYQGRTALMTAAKIGHKEVVQVLLAAGANPEAVYCEGKTALAYAEENGHDEIAELLSKRMSD